MPQEVTTDPPLTPFDWQQADIDRAVKAMRSGAGALITSAPGAGKTLVATEIARELQPKTLLIIAPQGTHQSAWGRTLMRQGYADEVRVLIGTAPGKRALEDLRWGKPGVYITTPQWFSRQKWNKIRTPEMIIFDEIHMAGAYGINTQKQLHKLIHAKYRLGLSGTPLRNKFENAWAIVKWVEPSVIKDSFWVWRMTKCKTKFAPFAPQQREVVGELRPGELFNSMTCYIQHLQRERCCDFHPNGFLANLPAPLRIERVVEMSAPQRKFYDGMERMLAAQLLDEDGEEVRIHAENFLTARGALRSCALALPHIVEVEVNGEMKQRLFFADDAPSPKLDALIEDLPSFEGRHTLVLTHSKRFARVAVSRLQEAGYAAEGWHGDVSKTRRNQTLAGFISGEIEIIVGVISAMGTGTDGLQEACWNIVWMSRDDDAANNIQGLGRLDRLGQKNQVVEREYLSDKTIDVGFYGAQMKRVLALEESLRRAA